VQPAFLARDWTHAFNFSDSGNAALIMPHRFLAGQPSVNQPALYSPNPKEARVSRIALALMFGSAVLLASDASFARPRGRVSSPPPKSATVAPSKTAAGQLQKAGAATQAPKPFAAAPRPGRATFISINSRPYASGAAPAYGAMHDDGGMGLLQYDPSLGSADENAPAASGIAKEQIAAAARVRVNEPSKAQPLSSSLRAEVPWAPASGKSTASGQSASETVAVVCAVQRSGACVPF
jgi:hypothetical protein